MTQRMVVTEPRSEKAGNLQFGQAGTGCRKNGDPANMDTCGYRKTGEVDLDHIIMLGHTDDVIFRIVDENLEVPEEDERLSDPDDWVDVCFMLGFDIAARKFETVHEFHPSSRQNEGYDSAAHKADLSD